ncbi:26S proteasome regulatory subunit 4 homolog, partial [Camellia sinensis]|uniref:26S proteasome regulatory subunit 4 homolog n=1 Tax=Camellia sinensis TaxID=4442 RepID=UPI0010358BE9
MVPARPHSLPVLPLAFPDAVYLVDAIQGGKVLMNACKPALESSYIHLLIFSSLLNKLSAVAAVCPQRRPVLLAAIRPTFCPGGASRRNSAGMTNMLMVTTTMGMLHGVFCFMVHLVQKYLDEGPRMVRNVFRLAKENAPAIILIDEVDAIATARFDAQTEAKNACMIMIIGQVGVAAGSEGSAHDTRIFLDTIRNPNYNFSKPQG